MKIILICAFFLLCAACKTPVPDCAGDYDDSGIFTEVPDTLAESRHLSYSTDNEIYAPGRVWAYAYTFTKAGREYHFIPTETGGDRRHRWALVDANAPEYAATAIVGYRLKVPATSTTFDDEPDYDQTIISFTPIQANSQLANTSSFTGVVENCQAIWIHPNRMGLFMFNQITPYPYVQFPLTKGDTYNWQFRVGDGWGSPL